MRSPFAAFGARQVGDSQAAKIESKRAGGADRRATFSRELCELVKVGSDVGAGGVKGGRKILLEIAAGTIGRLSQALSGEIRVSGRRTERASSLPLFPNACGDGTFALSGLIHGLHGRRR